MVDLVAIAENLSAKHGPAVPLDELRRAADMPEPAFRSGVLSLASKGRFSLHADPQPQVMDADKIDRRWHVASAGEVKYVAVATQDPGDGFAVLGTSLEDERRARCIAFLEYLYDSILPGRRR